MLTEDEIKAIQDENATLKASVETLTTSTTSMQSKMDQLLTETKTAKAATKAASDEAQRIIEEKAKKDGDFEAMFKASETSRGELQTSLDGLRGNIATERRNSTASKIAGSLAEGANAELLSAFIQPRLKYTEDGVKILNEQGELTVLTVDDLATEFKSNTRYSSLLKGNQSSGGGANGGQNSGGAAKTEMTRSDFDALPPVDQMKFMQSGGITKDQ